LGADEALAAIVRRRLDKALDHRDRDDAGSFTARVRRLVVQALGEGPSTADSAADALGVSRRTLSRRLAEENTSFSRILDTVREDVAKTLLQDRSLSIGDIAFFLQYSEPAAFHRSFRRWTGQTPVAFRESSEEDDEN
jgi:AraC-like DNA-binding protein